MNNYKPKWKARTSFGFITIIMLMAFALAACPSPGPGPEPDPDTPVLDLTPSPVNFGSEVAPYTQPAAQTITITNNGTGIANVSNITLTGTNAASFTLGDSNVDPGTIAVDATRTFTVQPKAGLAAGTHNATVSVAYDGPGSPAEANVSFEVEMDPATPYRITGSGTSFTASQGGITRGSPNHPIQDVITAIRTHANGGAVTIQFGNGSDVLDIGEAFIEFNNTDCTWGNITLTGKIKSENNNTATATGGVINALDGINITSTADIMNTSTAASTWTIRYNGGSTNTFTINSGTVQADSGMAINIGVGNVIITGDAVISSNASAGSILGTIQLYNNTSRLNVQGGTVRNTNGVGN